MKYNLNYILPEGEEEVLNIAEARSCITKLCNKYTCTEADGEDCCDRLDDTNGVPFDYDTNGDNMLSPEEF